MSNPKRKQEIVTFKVDEPLLKAMNGIPNRSEFIRAAILSALDSVCSHRAHISSWGGETEYADMRAAYDALSPRMKEMVAPLVTEHWALHSRFILGDTNYSQEQQDFDSAGALAAGAHPSRLQAQAAVHRRPCRAR